MFIYQQDYHPNPSVSTSPAVASSTSNGHPQSAGAVISGYSVVPSRGPRYENGSFYTLIPANPAFYQTQPPGPHQAQPMQQVYQLSHERNPSQSYEQSLEYNAQTFNDYTGHSYDPQGGVDVDTRSRTISIHSNASISTASTHTSSSASSISSPYAHRAHGFQFSPRPHIVQQSDYHLGAGYSPSYAGYSPTFPGPMIPIDPQFNQSELILADPYNAELNQSYSSFGVYEQSLNMRHGRTSQPIPIPAPTVNYGVDQDYEDHRRGSYPARHLGHLPGVTTVDLQPPVPPVVVSIPPAVPTIPKSNSKPVLHPYSSYNTAVEAQPLPSAKVRSGWPCKFEDQIFTPEDLKLPASKRRRIYINSLEQQCNRVHGLLKSNGLLTAPVTNPHTTQDIVSETFQQEEHISPPVEAEIPTQGKGKKTKVSGKSRQSTKLSLVKIQHEINTLKTRLVSLTEPFCKQSSSPESTPAVPDPAMSPHPFSTASVG